LKLYTNQFYGDIPISICNIYPNLDLSSFDVSNNNFCPPYPDCLVNQEPFTDENGNGVWDESEPYVDTNENGIYEEDYVGYQQPSECPGEECQLGNYNGYYDCSQTCLTPIYFDYLGDDSCDDSGISFDCYNYGYDCGDCSEDWDGTDPLGFCSECTLGDINGDSSLNILDLVQISNLILDNGYNECGDTNSDGELNILDLVILVNIILDN